MTYWFLTLFIALFAGVALVIYKKNINLWLGHFLKRKLSGRWHKYGKSDVPTHVMFCFVDHYEPQWGKNISIEQERARVDRWLYDYPQVASQFKDADGQPPKHSFFYPEEEYRQEHLDKIAYICAQGYGEIEVHLHHHDDTSDNLRMTLERFTETLHENHGAFCRNPASGKLEYAFIHGNWCLNNSRPDGQLCGVNDELIVLKETGCFADLTFPSAPSDTQPAFANEIYYAKDNPGHPNSHNVGKPVERNGSPWGDLMIITGPLALNWRRLKKKIFPQIENSDIRGNMPPSSDRIDLWVNTQISVKNKEDWLFIKIHTHGTQEESMDTLLGKPFVDMCEYLENTYNDGKKYKLHYVSAREMYNIIKAAEADVQGEPGDYRDFIIPRPEYKVADIFKEELKHKA